MKEDNKEFDIDSHLVNLLMHEPFFASIIRKINKVESDKVPTAGVTVDNGSFTLYWNRSFLESLTSLEVRGLFKHECYHLIFSHCTSRKQDPHVVWNCATDLAINSMIPIRELPKGGLIPGEKISFSDVKDKSVKEHMHKISKFIESLPKRKASEWYFEKINKNKEIKELMEQYMTPMDCHDIWSELSDEEKQLAEGMCKDMLRDAIKKADKNNSWGTVSSETRSKLRKIVDRSINWKKVLENFVGMSQRSEKARTHRKINRKYPYIHPGVKRGHSASLAIYIDQSGSVDNESLALFFGALGNLAKRTEFTMWNFDTSVDLKSETIWRKGSKVEPKRTRSGGTCFNAVEDHFRDVSSRFDGYMVLTDGECSKPPASMKRRCWVICPDRNLYFKPDRRDVVVNMKNN